MVDNWTFIEKQIDWFVTSENPMTIQDSKEFLMNIARYAYVAGENAQFYADQKDRIESLVERKLI